MWEVMLTMFVIALIIVFFALLKYNQHLKLKKSSIEQLFIYKARQKGLSGYQVRILTHIVTLIKLNSPEIIFINRSLFESGLIKFIQYIANVKEPFADLKDIFKDIIITYERVYNSSEYQQPLGTIDDLTSDTMIAGYSQSGRNFLAKIMLITDDALHCKYFRKPGQLPNEIVEEPVSIQFFRCGDAEYSFDSEISGVKDTIIIINKPTIIKRGKEVHHPFIQTLIPVTIEHKIDMDDAPIQAPEATLLHGTIERLNEFEAVVRTEYILRYQNEYILIFTLDNFKIEISSTIIASNIAAKEKLSYYTFKLIEMSDAARNVINKYVRARL